jgi:hypothetical protein
MTEVEVFQDRAPVQAQPWMPVAAPMARNDIDSWTLVVSDVIKLANVIAETEFVPKRYRGNAPAVAAAILAGRELDLPPMTALRHVQVVEGSPSLSAEYKRARVLAAGHDLDIVELTTTRCRVVGRRRGTGKPPLEITFTIDDAKKAGLVKPRGAWETRPRRMLFARAGTEVCDFMFADITNGLPTTELLAEGGEDAFEGYAESPAQATPAPAGRTAQRRQRTQAPAAPGAASQRKEGAAETEAGQESSAVLQPTEMIPVGTEHAGLPPLPGEDEDPTPSPQASSSAGAAGQSQPQTRQPSASSPDSSELEPPGDFDPDEHGTATRGHGGQLTALWTVLNTVYDFESKDMARGVVEKLVGRQLDGGTTGDLSFNEAKKLLDALALLTAEAKKQGITAREQMIVFLTQLDEAAEL